MPAPCTTRSSRAKTRRRRRAPGTPPRRLPDRLLAGGGLDLSGVEIAATAFANLVEDVPLHPLGVARQLTLVIVWGLVLGAICRLIRPIFAAALVLSLTAAYLWLAQNRFAEASLWLPSISLADLQVPLAHFAGVWLNYRDTKREREMIKRAFGYFGSEEELINAVEIARAVTNLTYINSDVQHRLQLIYPVRQLNGYVEAPNPSTTSTTSSPAIRLSLPHTTPARSWRPTSCSRHQQPCQLRSVLHDGLSHGRTGGEGLRRHSLSMSHRQRQRAHEIGHVMSARDDEINEGARGAPFDFNHGDASSQPTGGAPGPWMTVMSTNAPCREATCSRIPFWSNPDPAFGYYGSPTGRVGHWDNHRTPNTTAALVANFQCSASRTQTR